MLDLERDTRVLRDGDRIVGYGLVRERGEPWRVEGYVHPDAHGRGIGKLIATGLEEDAARHDARRIQNGTLEADSPPARCSSRSATAPYASSASCGSSSRRRRPQPSGRTGCGSFRSTRSVTRSSSMPLIKRRSRRSGTSPRATSSRGRSSSSGASVSTRRSGASSALETSSPPVRSPRATRTAAAGSTSSSPVARGAGRASARRSSPTRSGASGTRGEDSVGLGVDAASDSDAFRLYERAGMAPTLGWLVYEKELGGVSALSETVVDAVDNSSAPTTREGGRHDALDRRPGRIEHRRHLRYPGGPHRSERGSLLRDGRGDGRLSVQS